MRDDKEVFEAADFVIIANTPSEWFALTPQLRLIMPSGYDLNRPGWPGPILQQAEQGSLGTVRWRTIPVVEVTLAEYEAAQAEALK